MNIYCNYLTITNKTFIFIHAYFLRILCVCLRKENKGNGKREKKNKPHSY